MKKLLIGCMVALLTMTFSAFTTKTESKFLTVYYYLGADGNYHKVSTYNYLYCVPNVQKPCAYSTTLITGMPDTLEPAVFQAMYDNGLFTPTVNKGTYHP